MKRLRLYVFGCLIFSFVGCSTKEALYIIRQHIFKIKNVKFQKNVVVVLIQPMSKMKGLNKSTKGRFQKKKKLNG